MGSYLSDAFVWLHIGPGVREDLAFLAYCGLVNEDLQIPCMLRHMELRSGSIRSLEMRHSST